ncbi:MAG: RluA family pseudouridine synthase [Clostridia bacterium]|nr:RluA family pseudouridine synthase [Clostridia bacterium]
MLKKVKITKREPLKTLFFREFTFLPFFAMEKLCDKKDVKVNGIPVKKDAMLKAGDEVSVYFSQEKYAPYTLVYEDENILIADKKRGASFENLTEFLSLVYGKIYPVHRLDTNTAGLIAYAKNPQAESELVSAFREKRTQKKYLCRVFGLPNPQRATLSDYLIKEETKGLVRVYATPQKGALSVVTEYRVVEDLGDGTSVLSVTLHTGRTHQIRAHLAFHGYPLVGDGKYGNGEKNRAYKREKQELSSVFLAFSFHKESPLAYLNGKNFEKQERFYPKG